MNNRTYKALQESVFSQGKYQLVPIRDEDKYFIMEWRNEQIDILRQKEPLTKEQQEKYFDEVVASLFVTSQPSQLLFSFLEDNKLIGYGGLVHIDWESRNAEVSFITAVERNSNEEIFKMDFSNYLDLILKVGFSSLNFIKLHTTFYDVSQRVTYKKVIAEKNFKQEGHLRLHVSINNEIRDVFIYSCFKK